MILRTQQQDLIEDQTQEKREFMNSKIAQQKIARNKNGKYKKKDLWNMLE